MRNLLTVLTRGQFGNRTPDLSLSLVQRPYQSGHKLLEFCGTPSSHLEYVEKEVVGAWNLLEFKSGGNHPIDEPSCNELMTLVNQIPREPACADLSAADFAIAF
jgi:hypothetical protein